MYLIYRPRLSGSGFRLPQLSKKSELDFGYSQSASILICT